MTLYECYMILINDDIRLIDEDLKEWYKGSFKDLYLDLGQKELSRYIVFWIKSNIKLTDDYRIHNTITIKADRIKGAE